MLPNLNNVIAEWEVELAISGAIALEGNSVTLGVEKGEHNPFMTTVTLIKTQQGVKCILIARAFNQETANDAAVYFVGQALDVLSLQLNIPLFLSLFRPEFRTISGHVRRRMQRDEWIDAFRLGRYYSLDRHYFSRAISWYRKGLVSEDPIDRVIAFWSALEAIGSIYYRHNARTEQGIINQVCDCFDQLWGDAEHWHVISRRPEVVNQFHDFRNGFSHGFMRVDIETIRSVVNVLPTYQQLVYEFLLEWERNGVAIERQYAARQQAGS